MSYFTTYFSFITAMTMVSTHEFIEQRKQVWLEIEQQLERMRDSRRKNRAMTPQLLVSFVRNYRQVLSDVSLARDLFKRDPLVWQLNSLALRAHTMVAQYKRNSGEQIGYFFVHYIPQVLRELWRPILFSLVFFVASALFGFILVQLFPAAARAIVGDHYHMITLDNIQRGVPFAIYQRDSKVMFSSFLMVNNISVAILAFGAGLLYGVGTVWIMVKNGLLIGAVAALFHQHGLLGAFSVTVMLHGTLELSAIIIAGGAGLRLGQALFRPGNLPRGVALIRFGRQAASVLVYIIPLFILAGIIEAYITPLQISLAVKTLVIGLSVLVVFLCAVLPVYLQKRSQTKSLQAAAPHVYLRA